MRISDLWGGPRDQEDKKQAETIATEIAKAVKKDTEAFEQGVQKLLKEGKTRQEAVELGLRGIVGALEKAVEKIAPSAKDGERVLTKKEIEQGFRNVSDSIDEQNKLFKESLKNDEFRQQFMDAMFGEMEKKLVGAIDKNTLQNLRIYREARDETRQEGARQRRSEQEGKIKRNAKSRDDGESAFDKLLEFLTLRSLDPRSFIGMVSRAIEGVATGLGVVGLVSFLPDQARAIIGDFTAAFQTIRKLFGSNFLKPVFQLLDALPLVGAITRKIPFLNAVLFFFENLTDIGKKFSKEGLGAGAALTLQRLYSFFVGDVGELVAKGLDKLETLLGVDWVDWEKEARELNAKIVETLGGFKQFIDSGMDLKTLDPDAFHWDPGSQLLDFMTVQVNKMFGTDFEPNWQQWHDEQLKLGIERRERWTKWAVESWNAFSEGFGKTSEWVHGFLFDPGFLDEQNAAIRASITGAWTSVSGWFQKQWTDGIAALPSIGDSVAALITDMWEGARKWLLDQFNSVFSKEFWLGADPKLGPKFSDMAPKGWPGSDPAPESVVGGASDSRRRRDQEVREAAGDRGRRGAGRSGATTNVDASRRTNTTSYSLSGQVRASKNDPMSTSTGGGSGW